MNVQRYGTVLFRRIRLTVAALLLIAASQLSAVGARVSADAAWLDPAWAQRQVITITNSGSALANYQVKVTLGSGFDFSTAQTNGDDLRFTSGDGTSLLDYWVEAYNASARTATLWAEVPSLPTGATTLYLYYGNPAAPAASNGSATFPFFDDFNNPAWHTLPDMPFMAADETAAQVGGMLYIIGGYNNTASNPLNSNYRFDPATNVYTKMTNMPTARWGVIAAAVNDKIYVFGGQLANGSGTNVNQMYDPAANTWASKAALPSGLAKQGITGCTDGSKVYLFYNNLAYSYNPATNSYTQLASMPGSTPMTSWGSCSFVGGKVYVIGGYSGGAVDYNRVYNPATNTWSSAAPLPFRMYGPVRENPVIGTDIYFVQGQQADAEFSSAVYRYNTVTNTWVELSFGPHAADGVAGAAYNGKIYTFGGRQDWVGPYGLPYAAVYDPSLDTNQNWTQLDGNFEVRGGVLRRMVPPRGAANTGPFFAQIQSTSYRTAGNFVLEAQGFQDGAGWNTIGLHSNAGEYNSSFTGYLAPYNDFGVSPTASSIYRENGATYTKLASGGTATGTQRFKVASTAASIKLYRGGSLLASTNDTTYRNGSVSMITATTDPNATWDFLFTRGYAATEPSVSFGGVTGP